MIYEDLSAYAKAILAGTFIHDETILTMGNEESIFPKRVNQAMGELIMGGFVRANKTKDGRASGIHYRLTKLGKKINRRKSEDWMRKNARFSLTIRRPQ